ncbi:MAG: OmpA family protein [Bryobacterales bacterium]|nr:OmpA family protein [Bryobacterales bacterium]
MLAGQTTSTPITPANAGETLPVFRVNVVARTIPAINYHHRNGATMVDLKGTNLMPQAKGEARVESRVGSTKIESRFSKLEAPTKFGPEYLTYVLWAITPEGRAMNLGEVFLNDNDDDNAKLLSTSDMQAFGLIVTAEPYFAVTQPSDVVVMENVIRRDTTGTIQAVNAKYELLPKGQYVSNVKPSGVIAMRRDDRVPLQLQEAQNAIEIARSQGADKYAAETFQRALVGLKNAEGYLRGNGNRKSLDTVAREATQMAEDARIITIRRIEEERLAEERRLSEERQAKSAAEAAEAKRRSEIAAAEAEAARKASEQAEAERRAEAARRAQAEAAQREADRIRQEAEAARQAALVEADRVKREAEAARQAALAEQQKAQAEAELARKEVEKANQLRAEAEQRHTQLRQQLLSQLNLILETRDTARGLIVNMSDVLFDTGRYTLKPGAREKLAKISGILLAHPGLRMEVEGHTDSVGSDDYNQKLSEQRASSVRDYLTAQGVPAASISSRGFGESRPVAGNETAAGRQQNRRVELVLSGDVIGTPVQTSQLR